MRVRSSRDSGASYELTILVATPAHLDRAIAMVESTPVVHCVETGASEVQQLTRESAALRGAGHRVHGVVLLGGRTARPAVARGARGAVVEAKGPYSRRILRGSPPGRFCAAEATVTSAVSCHFRDSGPIHSLRLSACISPASRSGPPPPSLSGPRSSRSFVRDASSRPLLDHFAIQTAAWGGLGLIVALLALRGATLRDLAGATALDRTLWFAAGASVGVACAGAVLVGAAWRFGRRLGAVGAGIGIALQGVALLLLTLQFIASVVR